MVCRLRFALELRHWAGRSPLTARVRNSPGNTPMDSFPARGSTMTQRTAGAYPFKRPECMGRLQEAQRPLDPASQEDDLAVVLHHDIRHEQHPLFNQFLGYLFRK